MIKFSSKMNDDRGYAGTTLLDVSHYVVNLLNARTIKQNIYPKLEGFVCGVATYMFEHADLNLSLEKAVLKIIKEEYQDERMLLRDSVEATRDATASRGGTVGVFYRLEQVVT